MRILSLSLSLRIGAVQNSDPMRAPVTLQATPAVP